jgi:hypothetical protein
MRSERNGGACCVGGAGAAGAGVGVETGRAGRRAGCSAGGAWTARGRTAGTDAGVVAALPIRVARSARSTVGASR